MSLRIISRSNVPFNGREEAGMLLAEKLKGYGGQDSVVLGIPRGGIIIAEKIADSLGAELDIVLSHKLGAYFNPELAIGAISEDGKVFLNEEILSQVNVEPSYIEKEKAAQLAEMKERIQKYRKIRPKAPLKNKIVIVTDDGIATGATMQAALWAARQEHPKKLIAALPVGPMDSLERIAGDTDELLCLRVPAFFSAVGQFFLDFAQVTDEEVLKILAGHFEKKGHKS